MSYLLNFIYAIALLAASPWLLWSAYRKGKYREGFAAKLLGAAPLQHNTTRPRLWFHAVSVGEVGLIGTLLRAIEAKYPEWECVVSATTATGYALAKKKYPHVTVFYAPLDFSWAVRRAMRRVNPTLLVLAELELWPNLIRAAKEQGAKVAIINGRLGAKSFQGYRRVGWLVRRVLHQVDLVAAQNEEYAERFGALGAWAERIHVSGSLKFDGAQTDRSNAATQTLRDLAGFTDEDVVFLAGSTQAPEEDAALQAFIALYEKYPRLKLVLVPRHPHRFGEVAALVDRSGLPWRRRSQINPGLPAGANQHLSTSPSTLHTPHSAFRILLVDTVGELSAWWGTAAIGFVGGSLGSRGGQNMIEPAAYGVATCFGPNTQNFRDIVQMLLARDAAVVIRDTTEMTRFVRRCLDESGFRALLGERAQSLVHQHRGATARTAAHLERLAVAQSRRFGKAA